MHTCLTGLARQDLPHLIHHFWWEDAVGGGTAQQEWCLDSLNLTVLHHQMTRCMCVQPHSKHSSKSHKQWYVDRYAGEHLNPDQVTVRGLVAAASLVRNTLLQHPVLSSVSVGGLALPVLSIMMMVMQVRPGSTRVA